MKNTEHTDLPRIREDVLTIRNMVGMEINRAVEALKKRDLGPAHKIITDDAKITVMIGDQPLLKPLIGIPRMAEITIEKVDKNLQSFVTCNKELAKHVISMDAINDGLYDQVSGDLFTFMMTVPQTSMSAPYFW